MQRLKWDIVVIAVVAPPIFVGLMLLGAVLIKHPSQAQLISGGIFGWICAQIAAVLIIRRELILARLRDEARAARDAEQQR